MYIGGYNGALILSLHGTHEHFEYRSQGTRLS